MNDLILKKITSETLPLLVKMCTDSFETERGVVPDAIMPEKGMGAEFEASLKAPYMEGWSIYNKDELIGGALIDISKVDRNILELFFIDASKLGQGLGTKAWQAIEKQYPNTKIWETFTPISLRANIAFYVNNCGFKVIRINKDDIEWDCIFEKVLN